MIFGYVVRVYVAHKTLPKFLFEVRETLLVTLCAFRSEASFASQPNNGSICEERHSLALRNVIVGLL